MRRAYGNGEVFGDTYGDGPVSVVLLHGWARSAADFAAVGAALANAGVAAVALDLPGFGASPPPAHAGGARDYAARLAPIVREIAGQPLVLVGHSFGGRVALALAARDPELVTALVLTGTPLVRTRTAARPARAFRLVRALHRAHLVSDARLEAARQRYGSADYRAAQGVVRDVLVATVNESYENEMGRWRGPTTLVWGDADTVTPLAALEAARDRFAGPTELRVRAGVGHLTPLQAPDDVAAAALEFAS